MNNQNVLNFINNVLNQMPEDWLNLTTHRLDIYNENQAKTEFLEEFERLYNKPSLTSDNLSELPTAYDYIRLGHPLSSILEWTIAKLNGIQAKNVISFSSKTTPILAILRTNLLQNKNTCIAYKGSLPNCFDSTLISTVYGYKFCLKQVEHTTELSSFDGSIIFISNKEDVSQFDLTPQVDFIINTNDNLGSVLLINGDENENYISEIQHVRRRETIAMTPVNTLVALYEILGQPQQKLDTEVYNSNKIKALNSIATITNTSCNAIIGSSGLSIQYAIAMGLIHDAIEHHKGKPIKIIVPPNCYGGTNDQARRVAACSDNIQIVDLPVDRGQDMVKSIDVVLDQIAKEDAIPYIIAEIPTNPRVEVPDLNQLRAVLSKTRLTQTGTTATEPVFILDQTFCPNVHFLGDEDILSSVKTIAYASGSKFPSGGKCTAGYCTSNKKAESLLSKIELHLKLCDNEATHHQMYILAEQLPSMLKRINEAYCNTYDFVDYIRKTLPNAKINFVSEDLANKGFTPSVFSLDLPTKGDTEEEKEAYKRMLNLKLINLMIERIPNESKFCVSYGQLKGCYWTIPATSTQGTTKEGDKDYIVRVSVSSDLDLDLHKKVFTEFVHQL